MLPQQTLYLMEICSKFKNHLEKYPKTLDEIAVFTNTSKSHLSRVLNEERPLIDALRIKLNACLGTNFEFTEPCTPSNSDHD